MNYKFQLPWWYPELPEGSIPLNTDIAVTTNDYFQITSTE